MNMSRCVKAVFLACVGVFLTCAAAHAQVATIDAGSVGVLGEGGSYYTTAGDNGAFPYGVSNVIANGLEFRPALGISAVSNSADSYHEGSSLDIALKGLFVPVAGARIVGFTLTVSGSVLASGSGQANLFSSMSFVDLPTTGGSATTSWTNLGSNSQAFTFVRKFDVAGNLPQTIDWSNGHAVLSIGGNVSSSWRAGFCFDVGVCSSDVQGSANLSVSDVKLQALVAVAAPVPEADGVWMASVGVGLLLGVATRGRRPSRITEKQS